MGAFRKTERGAGGWRLLVVLMVLAVLAAACGGAAGEEVAGVTDGETSASTDDDAAEISADAGATGESHELTFATFTPDPAAGNPSTTVGEAWMTDVEEASDGRITFDKYWAEASCPAGELLACVRDGRADVGLVALAYTPSDFPVTTLAELLFAGQAGQDVIDAYHAVAGEFPAVSEELEELGIRNMVMWPAGRAIIGTTTPLEGVEDLDGLSLRASGALATALEAVGGSSVTLTAGETYEAVDRGVVDGYAQDLTSNIDFGLHEVAEYLTDPGIGHYATLMVIMSQATYDELDADAQAILDDTVAEYRDGRAMEVLSGVIDAKCDELIEVAEFESFTAWPQEESEQWADQAAGQVHSTWVDNATDAGVSDAQAILDAYLTALEESPSADVPDAAGECVDRWDAAQG